MKYNILIFTFLAIIFSSCDDFLDEQSQDEIIPTHVEHFSELLYGEAYIKNKDEINYYIDIMTDDVSDIYEGNQDYDARSNGFGYYTWQKDPQIRRNGTMYVDNTWHKYYHYITTCNIVINEIDEAEGDRRDKIDLKAEAHFLRGWYYFMLVNLFGEPFDPATADKSLGVPISNVTSAVDFKFKRSSVAKVYEQIESDLLTSIKYFKESNKDKNYFRANINAAYLLASRTFLYEKKWKEAKLYADTLLMNKPSLYDINKQGSKKFLNKLNSEVLLTYGTYDVTFYPTASSGLFIQSNDLMNTYVKNDLRKDNFFPLIEGQRVVPLKGYYPEETGVFAFAFRTSEAYLNRAEALAELGELNLAMDDINILRKNRLFIGTREEVVLNEDGTPKLGEDGTPVKEDVTYVFTDEKAADKDDAVSKVRKQRRLELCFEGHRWFDLRRWDRPRIVHNYIASYIAPSQEGELPQVFFDTFVLEKDDKAYTLPLPSYIKEINMGIKEIDRPERKPL